MLQCMHRIFSKGFYLVSEHHQLNNVDHFWRWENTDSTCYLWINPLSSIYPKKIHSFSLSMWVLRSLWSWHHDRPSWKSVWFCTMPLVIVSLCWLWTTISKPERLLARVVHYSCLTGEILTLRAKFETSLGLLNLHQKNIPLKGGSRSLCVTVRAVLSTVR